MSLEQQELLKEIAYDDCIKYGTPTLSVDHSNHYKRIEELMGIDKMPEKCETCPFVGSERCECGCPFQEKPNG